MRLDEPRVFKKNHIKEKGKRFSKSSNESALILECDLNDPRDGTHFEVLFSQSLCLLTVFLALKIVDNI